MYFFTVGPDEVRAWTIQVRLAAAKQELLLHEFFLKLDLPACLAAWFALDHFEWLLTYLPDVIFSLFLNVNMFLLALFLHCFRGMQLLQVW